MRYPIYAGSFYPSDEKELREMVASFLEKNKPKNLPKSKKLFGVIVPHAGYVYSGSVASFGYNALKSYSKNISKVILLGPSHHLLINGALTFNDDWLSPLGVVRVVPAKGLDFLSFDEEHSLEVQVPFLQLSLKKFSLTPIIYGNISYVELSKVVEESFDENSVIVVSSDLSHYESYSKAKEIDSATINAILSFDFNYLEKNGDACGLTAILALLNLAKKNNWKPVLFDYKNSGDTFGDKRKVVGYAAIGFFGGD